MQIKALSNLTIFGGSFNPLHDGHLDIIRALSDDPMTGRVMVIPNRVSPFKPEVEFLPDGMRLEMLQNALAGWKNMEISDLELRLPAPSYTFRTLQILSSMLPGTSFFLALGMDAFAEFAQWHHAAEILRMAGLVVFEREGWPNQRENETNQRVVGHNQRGFRDNQRDFRDNQQGIRHNQMHNTDSWRRHLPAPWDTEKLLLEPEGLVTSQGRLLLRHLPHRISGVSSRKIQSERSGEGVPPGAREILEAHWNPIREA